MSTVWCLVAVCVAAWIILGCWPSSVHGVSCWAMRQEGSATCGLLIEENVTKEECCKYNGKTISWSTVDVVNSVDIFRYETFYGGVPDCYLCERTCKQTQCPAGRRCVMKSGRPRCVCKPDCTHDSTSHRGPVCATNGRKFRSMCSLLKMKCRQQDEYFELDVAYNGPCQESCENVECLGDKCCEEDQHGRPHCVSYSAISCPGPFRNEFVCGADGITYETLCQLRRTSCSAGNIIPVAHEGKCKNLTSCNDTSCVKNKECYWDQQSNTSRCILCNYTCSGWPDQVPLCASDGQTYQSWCEMQNQICQTGVYVSLVNWGSCDPDGHTYNISETGSGMPWDLDQIDFTPSSRQVLYELRSSMYRNQGGKDDNSTTYTTTSHPNPTALYGADGTSDPASDKQQVEKPISDEDISSKSHAEDQGPIS